MRGLFTNNSLNIQAGQAVSGIADHARTLRICSGCVWITVEGISQDYWLSAGDTFAVTPGRLIVVQAYRIASRVDITPDTQQSAARKLGARLSKVLAVLQTPKAGILTATDDAENRRVRRSGFAGKPCAPLRLTYPMQTGDAA